MIDIKRLDDQVYLQAKMIEIDRSDNPILDISSYSEDNKAKVISAYDKLKFKGIASKTPLILSLLTEVSAPEVVTHVIELFDELPMAVETVETVIEMDESDEDGFSTSDTPKRKRRK